MKAVILCGGLGTRLSEETVLKPKPMIEIGGMPVLWHIMKIYASHGIREFVLALGYKGEVIKDFFVNYRYHSRSLTVEMHKGQIEVHQADSNDDWTVHLLDTGLQTQTGGRLKQAGEFIGKEPFLATYGDGVTDLDVAKVIEKHRKSGKLATVTAVRPPARFGKMIFNGDLVSSFEEKPQAGEGWINGGFFVLQPEILDYIEGEASIWEREPMERLASEGQLNAYRHEGFWQCMDTLRDVRLLETLWHEGNAPWRSW